MASNKSIFTGLLDVVKSSGVSTRTRQPVDPSQVSMLGNLGGSSTEDIQQGFLDWQVQKMAGDLYRRTLYFDTDRVAAYQDYRAMDHSPEVAQALDIMRDECLVPNEYGEILQIYSDNQRIKDELKDLFHNRLNINYMLSLWIRDLLKYGDYMVHLQVDKEEGIIGVQALPQEEVFREEGFDDDPSSVRFRWETSNIYLEDWQVAHFRLIEDTRRLPYGRSVLDPARKLWKQLQLAEDALLVYRITRAPDRRIFYVEVGNLENPEDVKGYLSKIQKQLKKQPIVNSNDGTTNFKYDPLNVTEDYVIPIRGDHHSKIDTLPGACLSLDTKISLLDGRDLELSEIIKEYNDGKELWSYSINPKTGEIVPGPITWAGVTRKNTQVLRLTLDNGETITCTPDHKFPTKFNGKKEAKDLEIGESLWSFNKDFKKIKGAGKKRKRNTYEMIYDHNSKKMVYTHRLVANYMKNKGVFEVFSYLNELKNEEKKTIHHKDFNRYNNNPSNLCFMNSRDHFYYHQDSMKNLEDYFGTETYNRWKENRKKGLDKYWENITEQELEEKRVIARRNFKKGSDKLQELMKNPSFKEEFYEKTSKGIKKAKNTKRAKKQQSEIAKRQWETTNLRDVVKEKQTFKYSDKMLQMVVDICSENTEYKEVLNIINKKDHEFMKEFFDINLGNQQLKKMKSGFTYNNLRKMMYHFGYDGWRDFTNKLEFFNHKVIKIEWLDTPQDTGTITIDGPENLHDHHNFALTVGVFTQNSNLGEIQDINYLQNKLFASLKVPKPYLNFSENIPGGATLSQSDIRFARTINRFQELVLMELRKMAKIHLFVKGFKGEYENFALKLNNPSTQMELMKLEIMKARLEVAKEWHSTNANSFASWTWVMEYILGFSKQDIKTMLKQKKLEKKLFAEIDSAPETYKKTGFFRDIDKKFEMPGVDQMGGTQSEEGGGEEGFGASSALGDSLAGQQMGGGDEDLGGGGGGAPSMPTGGGEDIGGGAPEGGGEELSEASWNSLIGKLLMEENKSDEDKEDDSTLRMIKNQENSSKKVKEMMDRLSNKISDEPHEIIVEEIEIEEDPEGDNKVINPLFRRYNELAKRAQEILNKQEDIIQESFSNDEEDGDVFIEENE